MMDFIGIPAVIGIISFGFYKLIELFVCRKERLLMIEKMGDKLLPDMVGHKINFSSVDNLSFSALKFGCLFMGIGLGLLIAFFIHSNMTDFVSSLPYKLSPIVYASCLLLFGGLGLLIAFLIELKINKKNKKI